MTEWWSELTALNQGFYAAAAFFSVFFLWQMIMALIGLGGGEDVDADGDAEAHIDTDVASDADADADADVDGHGFEAHSASDAEHSLAAFKLLSIRSILAFCMLFTWASALYLNTGEDIFIAMSYALVWGLAGMILVAAMFYLMRKLTETGTPRLSTSVGSTGSVYINIPSGGLGEVRVSVGGTVTVVKARGVDGAAIPAGVPVTVTKIIAPGTVEVKTVGNKE